jgi:hypothetical protein
LLASWAATTGGLEHPSTEGSEQAEAFPAAD